LPLLVALGGLRLVERFGDWSGRPFAVGAPLQLCAWAQFGAVPELPNIHHRKEWEQGVVRMPDYRITCLFVDRGYRRAGLAAVAVRGALALIAAAGGGLVEAYPHDLPEGKKTSASFLYNATRTMYERLGFTYERSKGKGNCVMSAVVPAATS
jgi:GNAT superfamily N-acetyltransferase